MIKILARLMFMIVLALSPGISSAALTNEDLGVATTNSAVTTNEDVNNIMTEVMNQTIDYDSTSSSYDYLHDYMGQLWGTFIYGIWDTGDASDVSVLAYAVGFVNIVAMLLAVITFLYVYLLGAVGTAAEASVMGKDTSHVWVPIRTAAGFALLLPVPGIGGGVFSTIQVFIIWVIITGSNAASVMWYHTVDFIQDGNQISQETVAPNYLQYNITKSLVCTMYFLENRKDLDSMSTADSYVATYTIPNSDEVVGMESEKDVTFFTRNTTYTLGATNFASDISEEVTKVNFANGLCGSVNFLDSDSLDRDKSKNAMNNLRAAFGSSMDQASDVTLALDSAGFDKIREQYTSSSGLDQSTIQKFSNTIKESSISLQAAIESNIKSAALSDEERQSFKDEMKYGGWINSIQWFYEEKAGGNETKQLKDWARTATTFRGAPNLCGGVTDESDKETCGENQEELRIALQTIDQFYIDGAFTTTADLTHRINACGFGGNCATTNNDYNSTAIGQGVQNALFSGASGSMLSYVGLTNSSDGRVNPFNSMQEIGNTLINIGTIVWGANIIAASAAYGLQNEAQSGFITSKIVGVVFGTSFAAMLVKYTLISIGAAVLGLLSNGFILAYVIPFMPVLTWIAMLIGYLLFCIEAVIAAPLAVVMMFTPEGKGIVGSRLQSAINLLNACALRPILMTLGILACIQLSYIGFAILNTFFWKIAQDYVIVGSNAGNPIDSIASLIIYTSACYQICKLLINSMPKLNDQIMQWMSSGVGRQFGEDSLGMNAEASAGHLQKGAGASLAASQKAYKGKKPSQPQNPTPQNGNSAGGDTGGGASGGGS